MYEPVTCKQRYLTRYIHLVKEKKVMGLGMCRSVPRDILLKEETLTENVGINKVDVILPMNFFVRLINRIKGVTN